MFGKLQAVADNQTDETTRTVGRVTSVADNTLTLLTPAGRVQQIATSETTVVFQTEPADADDVAEDCRVIVKYYVDSPKSAQEVIVLPNDHPYGLPVVERDPDWITLKNRIGSLIETYLGYSRIETVSPATVDDIAKGATLFGIVERSMADGATRDFSAHALIILPDDTTFGS